MINDDITNTSKTPNSYITPVTPILTTTLSSSDYDAIKTTNDMPRYSIKPTQNAPYPEFLHPRIYLEHFMTNLTARLDCERFERQCHRFLTVLTTDTLQQQELSRRFNELPTVGWSIAQKIYLDVCLTKEQRFRDMQEMANLGRQKGESYKRYASRILHYTNKYNIHDDSDIILEKLIYTISTDTFNTLILMYQRDDPTAATFPNIKAFCNTLQN
jgi:hypothetical protein